MEERFSAADTFRFVGDWYEMPGTDKDALQRRNARARELKAEGHTVRKGSHGVQLRSFGGIGSGRPHIEVLVRTYTLRVVA